MYRTVIVGSDARPGGDDARALAGRLAAPDGRIVVATVFDPRWPAVPPAGHRITADRRVSFQTVAGGTAALGLHALARSLGADLIVVGSSDRGRWGRMVAGDDTRQTVRGAPCAVAVAPRGYTDHDGDIGAIGVGWTKGPQAAAALAAARALAAPTGARLEALEVITAPNPVLAPGTYPHGSLTAAVGRAQERLATLDGVRTHAMLGVPVEELAHWSHSLDLLVVGATHRGALGVVLAGSVPEQLARRLSAPLLVVPEGVHDAAHMWTATDARGGVNAPQSAG